MFRRRSARSHKRRSYKKRRTLVPVNKFIIKSKNTPEMEEKKMAFLWNFMKDSDDTSPKFFTRQQCYDKFNVLRRKTVDTDGNCQFRAIADQIYGKQIHHDIVKDRIIESIDTNREFYINTFENNVEKFNEWFSDFKNDDYAWGTIETLRAACIYYNRVIIVYDEETQLVHVYDPNILRLTTELTENPYNDDEIVLIFNGTNHYDSVIYRKLKKIEDEE